MKNLWQKIKDYFNSDSITIKNTTVKGNVVHSNNKIKVRNVKIEGDLIQSPKKSNKE